jgi:hypothetical protein
MAPLRDRRLLVGGGDPGSEVGHVEREAGELDAEGLDHVGDDAPFGLFQPLLSQ